MRHDDDSETTSLREERGKPPFETPAERMADVPIAPHSAGALGGGPPAEGAPEDSASADRDAAEKRREP